MSFFPRDLNLFIVHMTNSYSTVCASRRLKTQKLSNKMKKFFILNFFLSEITTKDGYTPSLLDVCIEEFFNECGRNFEQEKNFHRISPFSVFRECWSRSNINPISLFSFRSSSLSRLTFFLLHIHCSTPTSRLTIVLTYALFS